ncbi:MAG: bile acid:sodium symporter [Paraburkholderia sp.]|uniref:bile acid:sodium symporter family protein n=1 Tax=Paraburkholderia sp. TaxID=1926495 RepID=UPI0011FFEE60|nr:bile acid:sodium symporter family protein [Paraburkholderia sp.]TAM02305.1 MAG: bile acid:sodium symporter [Paraburkholderia sp.]TAM30582.1 MAG: bile acid:sodium symporter [Paraburkholderia sp.]
MARPKYLPDNFTLSLIATVIVASFLPVRGAAATPFNWLTNFAVGLLFFLHGAKLSREAIIAGATHWRLHLVVLASTFIVFPVFGVVLKPVLSPLVTPALYAGVLFLCTLPSTVQSSIAFTSIARGNVPAAVCSASASSLIGIFVTPALVSLIVTNQSARGGSAWHTIWNIVLQLLVPFIAGQLLRPVIGRWIGRNIGMLKFVDQGSILLVVYGAFSEAVNEGLWHHIPLSALGGLFVVNAVLLALALGTTMFTSRKLGFSRTDQITIIFCGSKKSLAAGVPMAKVIFASNAVGAIVLPLMLFHQIQLMVCAALAQRWGARDMSRERDAQAGDESRVGSSERSQAVARR